MFFLLIYGGFGIFLLLYGFGLLKGRLPGNPSGHRRVGILVLGFGLLILGAYYGYLAYFLSTPEGKAHQKLQRKMQRNQIKR